MRVDPSRAPAAFANDIEAFLGFISLERGLSPNTVVGYRRDLDQAAQFFVRHDSADWRAVTSALAAAWVQSLTGAGYRVASLGRKVSALRMLARKPEDAGARVGRITVRARRPAQIQERAVRLHESYCGRGERPDPNGASQPRASSKTNEPSY